VHPVWEPHSHHGGVASFKGDIMRVRSSVFLTAVGLLLLPGPVDASGTRSDTSGGRTSTSLRVQAPRASAAKPGPMTCHDAGCIELFIDACGDGGGFSLEDPILNENGGETGAAYMECL
jgi:hypothetical protein